MMHTADEPRNMLFIYFINFFSLAFFLVGNIVAGNNRKHAFIIRAVTNERKYVSAFLLKRNVKGKNTQYRVSLDG